VVSPGDWLVRGIWYLYPQCQLQMESEVTHYQFVDGDLICCCYLHVPAALPYFCKSVWSACPPARWNNSILSTALSSMRLTQPFSKLLLWEVNLSLHSHFQPLFSESSAPCSTPVLRSDSAFHPTPTVGGRILFTVDVSVLYGEVSICPGAAVNYVPRGWVGELCVVYVAHLFSLQIYTGSFETGQ
jgi:hypothetical protein